MTTVQQLDRVLDTLRLFQAAGCPVCSGDCGAANPQINICPMQEMRDAIHIVEWLIRLESK